MIPVGLTDPYGEIMLVYLRVAGRQFIELFPAGGQEIDGTRETGHICFEVEHLDSTIDAIRRRGGQVVIKPQLGIDGSRQAWILDPDGRRIEFMQIMEGSLQAEHFSG